MHSVTCFSSSCCSGGRSGKSWHAATKSLRNCDRLDLSQFLMSRSSLLSFELSLVQNVAPFLFRSSPVPPSSRTLIIQYLGIGFDLLFGLRWKVCLKN